MGEKKQVPAGNEVEKYNKITSCYLWDNTVAYWDKYAHMIAKRGLWMINLFKKRFITDVDSKHEVQYKEGRKHKTHHSVMSGNKKYNSKRPSKSMIIASFITLQSYPKRSSRSSGVNWKTTCSSWENKINRSTRW